MLTGCQAKGIFCDISDHLPDIHCERNTAKSGLFLNILTCKYIILSWMQYDICCEVIYITLLHINASLTCLEYLFSPTVDHWCWVVLS